MRVLVVVDMQNDFIDGALGTKEAQGIVKNVAEEIKNFDGLKIFTADTHTKDYLNTQEGRNLPVEHCIEGTDGWEISTKVKESLRDDDGMTIFTKNTFGSVQLGEYLRNMQDNRGEVVEEVELIGLCTDICVISNAMLIKAFLPEAVIKVKESCCAGVTPESHKNALEAMKVCQIQVI